MTKSNLYVPRHVDLANICIQALLGLRFNIGQAYYLERQNSTQRAKSVSLKDEADSKKGEWLYCARCQKKITHNRERINKSGDHAHRFSNPHGIVFNVGCFARVWGCVMVGEQTPDDSWFSGFSWRIALCGRCNCHLGWQFVSAESHFYCLILRKLMSH